MLNDEMKDKNIQLKKSKKKTRVKLCRLIKSTIQIMYLTGFNNFLFLKLLFYLITL